jgi:hypothetical protein
LGTAAPSCAGSLDRQAPRQPSDRWQRDEIEPYKVLAGLPFPIYITTNLNSMLEIALREAGKKPEVVICPWKEDIALSETIFDRDPKYYPEVDCPLVYHLFGRLAEPDTVVLTEDDYFDFLIGVTRYQDRIPKPLGPALTKRALLFLGFQIDQWNFRVLLRHFLSMEGINLGKRQVHVAAQIEPEEGRLLEPKNARAYLEEYYESPVNISIYWGSAQVFQALRVEGRLSHPQQLI